MNKYIKINDNDLVVVALEPIPAGTTLDVDGGVTTLEDIPAGHKIALVDIPEGNQVIKYGFSIGLAKEDIKKGAWIHTHNVKTGLGDLLNYTYEPTDLVKADGQETDDKAVKADGKDAIADSKGAMNDEAENIGVTFNGFLREDGRAGVRNEVWVIPTVGCVNNAAQKIVEAANKYLKENCPDSTVDEVVTFPHPYGCSQMGDDQENTRTILSDLINHPNAGAVLVLGLGCENSNIDVLKPYIGENPEGRVSFLVAQEVEDEIETGLEEVKKLIGYASKFQRQAIPADKLIVGLKCGGSDGLSGITANPLVGRFSDLLIGAGGTTILTEVPEMFGAETILMNRCANQGLFDKTVTLINDFKNYFKRHDQTIYENPSPGNKKGGITTLEDKSLGCTQKSGSSIVRGVLAYGERVTTPGLNLLSAPGNDLVAATALAASGAQIVLFTTGRGTPFASPVPTVKISTNSPLAGKKNKWIDFNAGRLVEGEAMAILEKEFFNYILAVANGQKVWAEKKGFHDMAIFKQGVTL